MDVQSPRRSDDEEGGAGGGSDKNDGERSTSAEQQHPATNTPESPSCKRSTSPPPLVSTPSWIALAGEGAAGGYLDGVGSIVRGSHSKFRQPRQLDDNNPYRGSMTSSAKTPTVTMSSSPILATSARVATTHHHHSNSADFSPTSSKKHKKLKNSNGGGGAGSNLRGSNASSKKYGGSGDENAHSMYASAPGGYPSFGGGDDDAESSRKLKGLGERSRNFSQILRDMLREEETKEARLCDTSSNEGVGTSSSGGGGGGGAKSDSESEFPLHRRRLSLKAAKKRAKKENKERSQSLKRDSKEHQSDREGGSTSTGIAFSSKIDKSSGGGGGGDVEKGDKDSKKRHKENIFTSSARTLLTKKKGEGEGSSAGSGSGGGGETLKEKTAPGSPIVGMSSPIISSASRSSRSLSLSNSSIQGGGGAGVTGIGSGAQLNGARTLEMRFRATPTFRDSQPTSTTAGADKDSSPTSGAPHSPRNRFSSPPAPLHLSTIRGGGGDTAASSPPASPRAGGGGDQQPGSGGVNASLPTSHDDNLEVYKKTLIERANRLAVQVTSLQSRLLSIMDEPLDGGLEREAVRAADIALANLKETMNMINNPPSMFLDESKKEHQQKQGLVLNAVLECRSALLSLLKGGSMVYNSETNTTSPSNNFTNRDEDTIADNCRRFASAIRYLISSVEALPQPKKKKKPRKKRTMSTKKRDSRTVTAELKRRAALNSIQLSDLQFDKKLGQGAFGDVFKGMWRETTVVAIKQLHGDLMEEHHRMQFLSESTLMMALPRHPNIVGCLGVCVDGDDCYLVLEFIPSGCLQTHLLNVERGSFQLADLLELAKGIAAGMDHLEANHIVHRDLALRNILLEIRSDGQHIAKVSDFGMARLQMDVLEEGEEKGGSRFSMIGGNKIPIKWTAPEALLSKKYSSKSDVWSFGVTLWEIYSFGETPYKDEINQVIIENIIGGEQLARPAGCPDKIYALMVACWNMDPAKRPSFREIFLTLREIEDEEREVKRKEVQRMRAAAAAARAKEEAATQKQPIGGKQQLLNCKDNNNNNIISSAIKYDYMTSSNDGSSSSSEDDNDDDASKSRSNDSTDTEEREEDDRRYRYNKSRQQAKSNNNNTKAAGGATANSFDDGMGEYGEVTIPQPRDESPPMSKDRGKRNRTSSWGLEADDFGTGEKGSDGGGGGGGGGVDVGMEEYGTVDTVLASVKQRIEEQQQQQREEERRKSSPSKQQQQQRYSSSNNNKKDKKKNKKLRASDETSNSSITSKTAAAVVVDDRMGEYGEVTLPVMSSPSMTSSTARVSGGGGGDPVTVTTPCDSDNSRPSSTDSQPLVETCLTSSDPTSSSNTRKTKTLREGGGGKRKSKPSSRPRSSTTRERAKSSPPCSPPSASPSGSYRKTNTAKSSGVSSGTATSTSSTPTPTGEKDGGGEESGDAEREERRKRKLEKKLNKAALKQQQRENEASTTTTTTTTTITTNVGGEESGHKGGKKKKKHSKDKSHKEGVDAGDEEKSSSSSKKKHRRAVSASSAGNGKDSASSTVTKATAKAEE